MLPHIKYEGNSPTTKITIMSMDNIYKKQMTHSLKIKSSNIKYYINVIEFGGGPNGMQFDFFGSKEAFWATLELKTKLNGN